MNIEEIRALAEIMKEYGITSFEHSSEGSSLSLERSVYGGMLSENQAAAIIAGADGPAQLHVTAPISDVESPQAEVNTLSESRGRNIASPMVGVFYSAPSPESPPFVQVGDTVKKGDVLCIIEAMKLMNEIQSEYDGVITDITVGNGQLVEFGQPLFKIT